MGDHEKWMRHALNLSLKAKKMGEVPVGAVLVKDGAIISEGWNCPIHENDPTAHAEIRALRTAAQKNNNYRIPEAELYVTLEPCPMCAGAIQHARIGKVFFGAYDYRNGAAGGKYMILGSPYSIYPTKVKGGILGKQCSDQLRDFFKRKRR